MTDKIIRVLIVDDSALVRKLLTTMLDEAPNIDVVGTASDPYIARNKIKQLNPDVLTLDVEMPRMDGISFLSNLMRLHPMPVVMVSSLTESGADVTLDALELGAIDFVTKPKVDVAHLLENYQEELVNKIYAAAKVNRSVLEQRSERIEYEKETPSRNSADVVIHKKPGSRFISTDKIIAIGASTGGTEAIKVILEQLPADMPGIVITQHIPAAFSAPFAARMDKSSQLSVCEATDGTNIMTGNVYIAPGDKHLLIERYGGHYRCKLNDGPPVSRHKPSVDVLFRSMAQQVGPNGIAVMLTGMGDDGAQGMLETNKSGAHTIAQDEKSSIVWGMPGAAVKIGAVETILPLNKIANALVEWAHKVST